MDASFLPGVSENDVAQAAQVNISTVLGEPI